MDAAEAYVVGQIACNADGGCHHCGRQLITQLQETFPGHSNVFEKAYTDYHNYGDDD